jgi:hypothetical protein
VVLEDLWRLRWNNQFVIPPQVIILPAK